MKIKDINTEISFELWIRPELSEEVLELGVGHIDPGSSGQTYKLNIQGKQWRVLLRDASSGIDLNFHLKRGCAHLAEVIQIANDGSALAKVIFFNGGVVEVGDIEIGVDERIEDTAKRNGIRFKNVEELCIILNKKCVIKVNDEDFFMLVSGPAVRIDFESNGWEDEDSSNYQVAVQEKYQQFSIYGERVRLPIEKRKVEKIKEIYFASKVIFKDNQNSDGALRLARGSVLFSDYTKTGQIRALAAGAMSRLTKESGSYLKQWDEYGNIEGEMLLARAKAIGIIDYQEKEKTGKGVKFFVSNIPDQLTDADQIELTSELPLYLKKPDITWEEYSKVMEDEFIAKEGYKKKGDDSAALTEYTSIINLSKTSIELKLHLVPQDKMFLILSINGDKTQIERRMRARAAILKGHCANPLLGLLIEEGGEIPNIQRVTKLKPLTAFVKEKIFKHPPTDKQVEAIDVALNTPDIALIQGPPGTGKTTVVTAILERLNEEFDKTRSIRGQVLVSGFQHDAVENIVTRLSINALPAVKFGGRADSSEFTEDAVAEKIYKWCSNIAENIRKKNPQIVQTEEQLRLAGLFRAYSLCPSKNNTVDLMKRILDLPRDLISEKITIEAEEISNSVQTYFKLSDSSKLGFIRSLRVSAVAFEDDGHVKALELLDKLEDELSISDAKVLEKAARWRNGKPLNFLPELKAVKESLIYRYLSPPDFRTEKPREDVLKLVAEVSQLLEKNLNSADKRDSILAEFLHELEDNPDGVRESIEDYNFVYAATTQQSEGKAIRRAKTKFEETTIKYDTIVIDEAARTSPRDLLIPMCQAEKRIILVGDHRQLPHLIDEEVAQALEKGNASDPQANNDFVKKSMFEYLFNRLKKLEAKDGIKRTVTLDAQYRTHPILGNFLSDNFYKKYGEGYRSPLPSEFFEQELKYSKRKKSLIGNKITEFNLPAAVWIDVPNSQGKEGEQNTSRVRHVEAEKIADYLNKWINSDEGVDLSFGVISFYKAQVTVVYEALQKFGLTELAQDNKWQIAQKYRFLENGEERVRIGTVDAFQGMEFDLVFLSMVRSQNMSDLPPYIHNEENYEKKKQRIFGHLMSENRLCVSMSRQKKVLIVVGDGSMVNSQIATDAVPALKKYYDLCEEKGAIL